MDTNDLKLVWTEPQTKEMDTTKYCLQYLVRLRRELGPSVCYISNDYSQSENIVVIRLSNNDTLSYTAHDRVTLKQITTSTTWTKHVQLLSTDTNSKIFYFSALPNVKFTRDDKKLFTLDGHIMIVNIHFIINSVLTGDIQIRLTGIKETVSSKTLVTCTIPCGYEMLSLIQNSLKDNLFST